MYQMKLTYRRPAIMLFRVKSEGGMMAQTGGTEAKSAPCSMQWNEPAITDVSTAVKKGGEWD